MKSPTCTIMYLRLINLKRTLLHLAGPRNGRKVLARSRCSPTNTTVKKRFMCYVSSSFPTRKHSLRVGWRNMCELPWFFRESSISCYLLCYARVCMYFFRRISHIVDSWFWRIIDRICWACAIFRWTPNLQVCTDGQTDRQTDGRINPGWAG